MNVLAIISARGGSRAVPRKNLRMLGGKPLIAHMIASAKAAKLVDRVIFCTEDDEIAAVATEYGAEIPFRRPTDLAHHDMPLIPVTKWATEKMETLGYRADVVVQLQPTCPFVGADRIDESVHKLVTTGCDSVVSLKKIEHEHPYRAKELVDGDVMRPFLKDIDVESFQQRQDLPVLFCTSGAIYTRRAELLHNYNGRDFCLGKVSRGIVLSDHEAVNIDRPIDFLLAEFLIAQRAQQPG